MIKSAFLLLICLYILGRGGQAVSAKNLEGEEEIVFSSPAGTPEAEEQGGEPEAPGRGVWEMWQRAIATQTQSLLLQGLTSRSDQPG